MENMDEKLFCFQKFYLPNSNAKYCKIIFKIFPRLNKSKV